MRTNTRLFLEAVAAITVGAILFGCAPQTKMPQTNTVDRMAALTSAGSSAIGGTNTNWNCPTLPNVKLYGNSSLNGGYDYSGAEDFTVCVPAGSNGNATTFQMSGSTGSSALCVYPLNQPPNGYPTVVASPQCYNVTGGPILLTFSNPAATINALVVVDSDYTAALNACLVSSQPCPAHSEGVVQ